MKHLHFTTHNNIIHANNIKAPLIRLSTDTTYNITSTVPLSITTSTSKKNSKTVTTLTSSPTTFLTPSKPTSLFYKYKDQIGRIEITRYLTTVDGEPLDENDIYNVLYDILKGGNKNRRINESDLIKFSKLLYRLLNKDDIKSILTLEDNITLFPDMFTDNIVRINTYFYDDVIRDLINYLDRLGLIIDEVREKQDGKKYIFYIGNKYKINQFSIFNGIDMWNGIINKTFIGEGMDSIGFKITAWMFDDENYNKGHDSMICIPNNKNNGLDWDNFVDLQGSLCLVE